MGHRFYERKHKCSYLVNLTAINGSVFPSAFMISFPCGIVCLPHWFHQALHRMPMWKSGMTAGKPFTL
eukprot:802099-Amphidinium_carterae.2